MKVRPGAYLWRRAGGSDSAPVRMVEMPMRSSLCTAARREGGSWIRVRWDRLRKVLGSLRKELRSSMYRVAPATSVVMKSKMEASKAMAKNWLQRSVGLGASARATLYSPRCGTITPLGLPVEPDV